MIGKRNQDFYKEYVYVKDLGHGNDCQLLNHLLNIWSGTFGEVVEAVQKKSKISRAVKMLQNKVMTSQEKEDIFREIDILKQLVSFCFAGP